MSVRVRVWRDAMALRRGLCRFGGIRGLAEISPMPRVLWAIDSAWQSASMATSAAEVLQTGEAGRVLTAFCDDVHLSRQDLRVASEELRPTPTLVGLEWEQAPALAREIDEIRDALADAARSLWPSWYTTVDQRFDDAKSRAPDVAELLRELSRTNPHVSASWLRSAWQRCVSAQLPIVNHLAAAQQVRQLAQALDPRRLVCVLSVTADVGPSARVRGLARAAEWLAHEASAKVILLVPRAWQGNAELDHVTYGALVLEQAAATSDRAQVSVALSGAPTQTEGDTHPRSVAAPPKPVPGQTPDAPYVSVGPICGKPHPKSYVEQRVHQSIRADSALAPLFEYNQRLLAEHARPCIVDLVWREGRLVVELDGDEHYNKQTYFNDRDRDYRLTLHGYTVLRITNMEVHVDVELAMAKIRSIVELIRKRTTHEGDGRK